MATGAAALGRASLLWGEARYHQRPAYMSFRCVFLDVNSIFGWVFHGSIVSNVVLVWLKQPFESDPFWRLAKKPGYNCAITACGKALQGSRVHDLLRQIDDRDLEATVVTLSAAMDAFNRIGNWQETLLLWPRFRGSLRANELLDNKNSTFLFVMLNH